MKSAGEIMEILEAFDLTESLRDAGELTGCSHHTVARYVAARDAGGLSDRPAGRPLLIDAYLPKIEEWVEASTGKIRADVAHRKLVGLGFTGSERTSRRAPVPGPRRRRRRRAGRRPVTTNTSHTAGQFAVVYECPDCEQRFLGERRCPDCQLFCRRIGIGGDCPRGRVHGGGG